MSSSPAAHKAEQMVGAVVVTYQPDAAQLTRLLDALTPQVDAAVVVDNGSSNQREVHQLAGQFKAAFIGLEQNLGIAAAQNVGIRWVVASGATHVLLSDQDSVPEVDMVQNLLDCLAENDPQTVGAVGPVPVDERGASGASAGEVRSDALVYSDTTWGPKRREIPGPEDVMAVPFVLASGCLIPVPVLERVGLMHEGLFIDHVDLAWCLRAGEFGYRFLVCGNATLTHDLGEDKAVLPGGREVHVQSPARNYYMVRNTLLLLRAPFMRGKWKAGYLSYLAKYLGFYTLMSAIQPHRFPLLVRGLRDGILGRTGPNP